MKKLNPLLLVSTLFLSLSAKAAVQLSDFRIDYQDGYYFELSFDDTLYEGEEISFSSLNDDRIISMSTNGPMGRILNNLDLSFGIDGQDVSLNSFSLDYIDTYSLTRFRPNYMYVRVCVFDCAEVYLNTVDTDVVHSAVPVPAAAWLFGSALLGLFGVKRRSV